MIDVIIPTYNAHETIKDTLRSIAIQTMNKDIHVYIIDDCSERDYKEEVDCFKTSLNITELRTPRNIGPGEARQYGIDHSQSDYIMFIDADDILYDSFSVERLYDFIDSNHYNAICSNFTEETERGSIHHNSDIIWMHGKMYRRSFLIENNIRFNKDYSRANEDTGFNHLVYLIDKIPYLNETTYIWRNNKNSITRRNNGEYSFSGLEGYINNVCYAIREAMNKKVDSKKTATLMCKIAYCIYLKYLMNKDHPQSYLILEWAKELKRIYLETINILSYEEKKQKVGEQFDSQREELDMVIILGTEFSFNKFLDSIQ